MCGRKFSIGLALLVVLLGAERGHGEILLYWTDNMGSVFRANADGSDLQTIVAGSMTSGYQVENIEINAGAQELYQYGVYRDSAGSRGFVRKSNLDGTSPEMLILGGILPESIVYGFTVDFDNGKMYMGGHGDPAKTSGGTRWANLDGSDLEVILPDVAYAHGMVVDDISDKLLYTDAFTREGVWRSDLDGGNEGRIISGGGGAQWLAFDSLANELYITRKDSNTIVKANPDGSNLQTILSTSSPGAIDLDLLNGKMYWGNGTSMMRANLDGSDAETLFGIVVDSHAEDLEILNSESVVPEPSSGVILAGLFGMCLLGHGWRRRRRRKGR